MALLSNGSFIDVRTIAGLAAEGSASFSHGLPAAPDFVIAVGAATQSSNVSANNINVVHDATNVTVQNGGEGASPVLRIISIVAHSLIR